MAAAELSEISLAMLAEWANGPGTVSAIAFRAGLDELDCLKRKQNLLETRRLVCVGRVEQAMEAGAAAMYRCAPDRGRPRPDARVYALPGTKALAKLKCREHAYGKAVALVRGVLAHGTAMSWEIASLITMARNDVSSILGKLRRRGEVVVVGRGACLSAGNRWGLKGGPVRPIDLAALKGRSESVAKPAKSGRSEFAVATRRTVPAYRWDAEYVGTGMGL